MSPRIYGINLLAVQARSDGRKREMRLGRKRESENGDGETKKKGTEE
jgi:hypothetical protein